MAIKESQPGSELSGSDQEKEIDRLMNILELDLGEENLKLTERVATLSHLKSFIRTPGHAELVFSENGVKILCQHSYDDRFLDSSREALKCLANALLIKSKTRQMVVDLGYADKAAIKLRNDNREDELLNSRILFLVSYDKTLDFNELFDNNDLAGSINRNIARHAYYYSNSKKSVSPSSIDTMALSETLKLLFNMAQFYPHRATALSRSIPQILIILSNIQLPSPPLQQPINYLINSLLNLDLDNQSLEESAANPLFPENDQNHHANRLIAILDASIRQYKEEQLETLATPLVSLLQKIYVTAPTSVKKHLRASLLPSNDERSQPLGRSDTFASRLLRLSTSPVAPNLRECVSSLMFELSEQNPTSFVRNVGYGFASGFLMSHDIPAPGFSLQGDGLGAASGGTDDAGETLTRVDGQEINPITGQRTDMEPVDTGPEMTDMEKEREAERLFVLFERLKATGLVGVVNPVERALEQGRLEELE